jgi:hypothetical protein
LKVDKPTHLKLNKIIRSFFEISAILMLFISSFQHRLLMAACAFQAIEDHLFSFLFESLTLSAPSHDHHSFICAAAADDTYCL